MISSPQRCICPSLQYRRYRSAVVPQCGTVSTVQTNYTVFGTSLPTSTGVEPRALPGAVQSLRQSRIQRALFPVGIIIIVASMIFFMPTTRSLCDFGWFFWALRTDRTYSSKDFQRQDWTIILTMSLLLLGRITVYNNTITLWNFDNAIVNFLPLPWPLPLPLYMVRFTIQTMSLENVVMKYYAPMKIFWHDKFVFDRLQILASK